VRLACSMNIRERKAGQGKWTVNDESPARRGAKDTRSQLHEQEKEETQKKKERSDRQNRKRRDEKQKAERLRGS